MSDRNHRTRWHAGAVLGFLLAFSALPGLAQNGRLLETVPVKLPEEDLAQLEKRDPAIRSWLSGIEVQAITYESDGLKVKGYMAAPKEGTRLPVVIWNRGGNRDFGHAALLPAVPRRKRHRSGCALYQKRPRTRRKIGLSPRRSGG